MSKLLCLLIVLCCTSAYADILFIDVNDSASEITEARREARRRGEALVIVPSRNSTATIEDELKRVLFAQVMANKTFSTLVVSGHYSRQKFMSETNSREISYSKLSSILRDPRYRSIRSGIDSVLLWGCYTARPRAIADWHALLPNTQMLAGFNFAAPSSNTIASPRIMRNILQMSHDNMNDRRIVRRVQNFVNLTQGSEDPYDLFSMTNLAVVVRGCYVSSKIGVLDASRLTECPPSLISRLISRRRRSYDPYLNANQSDPELRQRARSHGETGLYRFKVDSEQYYNCFLGNSELPDPTEIQRLCAQFDCN